MNKRNKKLREQLVYLNWLACKSETTMQDFANIYSMSTSNVHRAIDKWRDKDIEDFYLFLQGLAEKVR